MKYLLALLHIEKVNKNRNSLIRTSSNGTLISMCVWDVIHNLIYKIENRHLPSVNFAKISFLASFKLFPGFSKKFQNISGKLS